MPIGPHILQWLDDRKIAIPEDADIYKVLRDGKVFLQMLHAHIEHPPEYPKGRLDRWKLLASILLDAGIEITDYGLRMALFEDNKTLEDILQTIYALYNNSEGVTLPVSIDPEPEMSYPLMFGVVVDKATSTEDFKERLNKLISIEHPDATDEERNLLVLDEMAQRMEKVRDFDLKEEFIVLIFEQLKKVETEHSLRAAAILKNFCGIIGMEAAYQTFIGTPTTRMKTIQHDLMQLIRSPSTPPELLDFLHHFVLDLATPDKLTSIIKSVFVPQLTLTQTIEECSKLIEVAGAGKKVISNFAPWLLSLTGDIIDGGDGTNIGNFRDEKAPLFSTEFGDMTIVHEESQVFGENSQAYGSPSPSPKGKKSKGPFPDSDDDDEGPFDDDDEEDGDKKMNAEQEEREKQARLELRKQSMMKKQKENAALRREAVILALKLWTDFPDLFEALGELDKMKKFLRTEAGLALMGQQAVLSELSAVIFVCAEIYELLLDALRTFFNQTHQRRILLRALLDLHLGNPIISFGPLLDVIQDKLLTVQVGVAEGEALIMIAQHPGINVRFTNLTADLVELSKNLVTNEPFLHTHACAVLLMLGQTLGEDADFLGSIQYFTKILLTESEIAKHASLLFHCIIKLHHNSGPMVQEAMVNTAHLFVQILVRAIEREEKERAAEHEERQKIEDQKREEAEAKAAKEEEERKEAEAAGLKPKHVEEDPLAEAERMARERAERELEKVRDQEEKAYQKRMDWCEAVKRCVAELGVGFVKVPVAELDPPPTPKADTPHTGGGLTPGQPDLGAQLANDFANAEDIFNRTDEEDGLLHAKTFTTASERSVAKKPVVVQQQSRDMLEKMAKRKVYQYIRQTYVEPMVKVALEKCMKREFNRMIKKRGFIDPNTKVVTFAKERHEARLKMEQEERDKQLADEAALRDQKRINRDAILKSMITAKAKSEEEEKTPNHPSFFDRAIKESMNSEREWRKFVRDEEQKDFVQIYRDSRESRRKAQEAEARHAKLEEMRSRQQEQSRRELLRSKLDEYFEVKQQQEEAQRREDWEGKMQKEFEDRLLMAKKSDRQKREVALWRLEKERLRKEREAEEERERYLAEQDALAEQNHHHSPSRAHTASHLQSDRGMDDTLRSEKSATAQGRHRLPPLDAGGKKRADSSGALDSHRSNASNMSRASNISRRQGGGQLKPPSSVQSNQSSQSISPAEIKKAKSLKEKRQKENFTPNTASMVIQEAGKRQQALQEIEERRRKKSLSPSRSNNEEEGRVDHENDGAAASSQNGNLIGPDGEEL